MRPRAKLRDVLGIIATRLAEAPTVDDVLETTAGLASRAVASRGQAVYLLDGALQPTRTVARDLSDRFLGEYERFGRADDPHGPARPAPDRRDRAGRRHGARVRARGMGRILIVPLFGAHGVAGSVNLVRPEGAPRSAGRTS